MARSQFLCQIILEVCQFLMLCIFHLISFRKTEVSEIPQCESSKIFPDFAARKNYSCEEKTFADSFVYTTFYNRIPIFRFIFLSIPGPSHCRSESSSFANNSRITSYDDKTTIQKKIESNDLLNNVYLALDPHSSPTFPFSNSSHLHTF